MTTHQPDGCGVQQGAMRSSELPVLIQAPGTSGAAPFSSRSRITLQRSLKIADNSVPFPPSSSSHQAPQDGLLPTPPSTPTPQQLEPPYLLSPASLPTSSHARVLQVGGQPVMAHRPNAAQRLPFQVQAHCSTGASVYVPSAAAFIRQWQF